MSYKAIFILYGHIPIEKTSPPKALNSTAYPLGQTRFFAYPPFARPEGSLRVGYDV
jgi:hypothetical protein